MARAEELAYQMCQNGTIAGLMGWPDAFIADRPDIRKKLTRKRQERKAWLRRKQLSQADKNPVSAIFLGKNYLGQSDKQEHRLGFDAETASLLGLVDGKDKGRLPSQEGSNEG